METGKSGPKFDPTNWLSEDWLEAHPNVARGNLIWGGGIRRCVGSNLATIELITALCCLGREVKSIDMSPEVADTPFLPFAYPSDLPMRLTPLN
jgi:cytochrome P450